MSAAVNTKSPRYFGAVKGIVSELSKGSLTIVLPDGQRFETVGAEPGPAGELIVRQDDLFGRIIRDGDLGFAEAYMDGWYDTPDLQALLDVIMINNDSVGRGFPAQGFVRMFERLRHWMNRNTKSGSAKNISAHYDLGNEFYAKWLDETMSYSSALYRSDNENMKEAQINKYASICDRMNMGENAHVLEVGCGWGGFAEYAAGVRGAKVTGLTISREQHDFAKERMFREGLADKVEIVMRDYRDERGTYDGIASIEMFEAVGEKYWPGYFDMVRGRLKPGAFASLQIITIADKLFPYYRKNVDFIQKYIFPGG
ncbi:MAG: SAM-dependent methyltransferase, partial [Pikeienuella sp.]